MRWNGLRSAGSCRAVTVATLVALLVALVGLAQGSSVASAASPAGTEHVTSVVDVAGRSPFTGRGCNVATPYYTSPGGKEGEPFIAVNPRNPRNRIAVWMDAARATLDTAYTTDGGRRWTLSIPRGIDQCTGNVQQQWEASGDPWLSFGPDGVAYLSSLTWAHFVTPPARDYVSVVHVQTSRDGGRTWSRPVFVAGHHSVSDKPMVVADPYHAGVAFEIWRNQSFGLPVGDRGRTLLLFARTTNWGKTWSRPIRIESGTRTDFFGSPQLSVLKSGTLVATSSLAAASGGVNFLSWRSVDRGATWVGPRLIRAAPEGNYPTLCGQVAAGGDTGSSSGQQTVLNGRLVAFVSLDGAAASAGRGRIVMSQSGDGGRTWRTHTVVRSPDPLLLASITADKQGRLGLVWDQVDTAAVNCRLMTIPTRTGFAISANGGFDWRRPVTVGPSWWNLASGARGTGGFSGYFVGDYQSVAAIPGGFSTTTVQGTPVVGSRDAPPIHGMTGVVLARIISTRRSD